MPFVIIFVGIVLLLTAYNNNLKDLTTLLKSDVVGTGGQKGFIYWIIAVAVIGGIGYIKPIRPFANLFLALVVMVLILKTSDPSSGGGFFEQFNKAIQQITTQSTLNTPAPSVPGAGTGSEPVK